MEKIRSHKDLNLYQLAYAAAINLTNGHFDFMKI